MEKGYVEPPELPEWVTVNSNACVSREENEALLAYRYALAGLLIGKKFDWLEVRFSIDGDVGFSHSDDFDGVLVAAIQAIGRLTHWVLRPSKKHLQDPAPEGRPSYKVFDLERRHTGTGTGRDDETSRRIRGAMDRLSKSGAHREMALPPAGWRQKADALRKDFPNFAQVIDTVISPHLGIIHAGGRHRMSPVLLVGDPGIGKTFFAHAVAKVMGGGAPLFIDFSAETNGSALGGSSTFWANSSPGKLFDFLAWGSGHERPIANPLVLLDEIDKTNPAAAYSPLAALYGILESDTASRFQDQSVPDVVMDVSRVRFFLTANDATKIPEPLLSRLTVFHIPAPDQEQLRGVARSIYASLAKEIGLGLPKTVPEEVIDLAEGLSPREARVRMECAIATAVADGRKRIRVSDWPEIPTAASQKRRIGF
ncbi:AAA family ATPase [Rhodoferax sp.]|uniref:AAA family ATPase n=1 Tax=Rhodoferax sp. TaxID=50421 RepID=UPI0025F4A90F|nr:AAA family ATPase [Rhodoferax sp.]